MESKRCSKCKKVKLLSEYNKRPDRKSGYRSECRKCEYDRQYERARREPHKIRAKNLARVGTKKGKLQKPLFCERCFKVKKLDRHHPDYSKPLKIVWLCRRCHSGLKTA